MKTLLKKFLQIIFPSHCICCSKIVGSEALFCEVCWQKLEFISEPKCQICSYPFEVEIKGMAPLCGTCLSKKPSFDKTITIFRYNHIIRDAISDLKYRDQTFLAQKFAKLLSAQAYKEIEDCDLIVAVPLHPNRLKERRFNQTVLIAKNLVKNLQTKNGTVANPRFFEEFLGKKIYKKVSALSIHALEQIGLTTKLPKKMDLRQCQNKFICDLLWRVADKKPQAKLTKDQREQNLKRAFLVNKKYRSLLKNKKILLVDDVMTTGATLENCSKELKRRGAKTVVVLTIAKTVV